MFERALQQNRLSANHNKEHAIVRELEICRLWKSANGNITLRGKHAPFNLYSALIAVVVDFLVSIHARFDQLARTFTSCPPRDYTPSRRVQLSDF